MILLSMMLVSAAAAAPVSGAIPAHPPIKSPMFSPSTSPMDPCPQGEPRADEIAGIFAITLPQALNLNAGLVTRNVKLIKQGATAPNVDMSGQSRADPFHLYIRNRFNGSRPYAKVVIETPHLSGYRLFSGPTGTDIPTAGELQGVGYGDATSGNKLCGAYLDTNRKVATFYIILSGFTSTADYGSFNIGIVPNATPETPIFIDPKVRNDG